MSNPFKTPKAPEAPAAPDPANIIREQANANRFNVSNPYGTRNWTQGANGQWTMTDQFTGTGQEDFDALQRLNRGVTDLGQNRVDYLNENDPDGTQFFDELRRGLEGSADFLGLDGAGASGYGYGGGGGGGGGFDLQRQKVNFDGLPELGGKLDLSGLNDINTDFSGQNQAVRDALYQKTTGLMNPDFKRQEEQARQTLYNQGLVAGSAAYDEELNRLMGQQNQSRERAALDATIAGGQEEARLFQQALAARQQGVGERLSAQDVASKARAQLLGERERDADRTFGQDTARAQLAESAASRNSAAASSAYAANQASRSTDINARLRAAELELQRRNQLMGGRQQQFTELAALIQGARGGSPDLGLGNPAAIDVNGAYGLANQVNANNYNNAVSAWGQNANRRQQNTSDALGFMGSFLLSDRRAKTDIKRVGETDGGLGVYTYRYKNSPMVQMGVMAQEVEKKTPSAVGNFGGLKAVDYSQVH